MVVFLSVLGFNLGGLVAFEGKFWTEILQLY